MSYKTDLAMTIQFFRQYLKTGLLAIKIYWFGSVYRLQYFYWATLNLPQEEEKSPTMLKWLEKMNSILWQIFWESQHRLCGKVWQPELIWSEDSLSNQCQMLTWWVQLHKTLPWGGKFLWGFPGGEAKACGIWYLCQGKAWLLTSTFHDH